MYAAWLGRLFVFFLQTAACFLRVEVVKVIWDIFVNTHEFSPIQKIPLVVLFLVFFFHPQAFHKHFIWCTIGCPASFLISTKVKVTLEPT